jgi:transposase InsO family protein
VVPRLCEDRIHDGRKSRRLDLIDGFTHECPAIRVGRRLEATDIVDVLPDPFILCGVPDRIRSDNGPEFVATSVRARIAAGGATMARVAPGSPEENGCVEPFDARRRDALLDGGIVSSPREARTISESRRRHSNTVHPHASAGYRPPAPEVFVPACVVTQAAPNSLSLAPRPTLH